MARIRPLSPDDADPRVRTALERLAGRITADDMRAMNYAADVEHRDVARIAAEFLQR